MTHELKSTDECQNGSFTGVAVGKALRWQYFGNSEEEVVCLFIWLVGSPCTITNLRARLREVKKERKKGRRFYSRRQSA